ncbi:beta-propeller fold lactonase family protein [Kribbella sp.]|uniref:YVTN family beta-propeller repeat protein n=1 Tax=Kribbella sp. TaxID=1871183 RepID=UPI002D46B73D|nr:beta-propeller fold lactonase family protein [Kribbella sp.]HZX03197.1 beta-propeller fold lactonase family protein [Kribbella sp.]
MKRIVALSVVVLLATGACSGNGAATSATTSVPTSSAPASAGAGTPSAPVTAAATPGLLPGMPAPLSPTDVWAADRPGMLAAAVRKFPERIYVPNSGSNTVTEIDPRTYKVIRTFKTGREPQHVVPSWDLKTLWVNNDLGNTLTPINPLTGLPGKPVAVHDPYNLYFTPDGKHAVVMASNDRQLVFRDPHTMAVQKAVPVPCAGVNHADFAADGKSFLVSCEFSGHLLVVDTAAEKVVQLIRLPGKRGMHAPMPQDVKLSPNGRFYYVADMMTNGVWVLSAKPPVAIRAFIPTGLGAHGLYVTRNSRYLIVTNRGEGSVSLLDFQTRKVVRKIKITGGGSPDMGGVSPDGLVLWVSGRYNSVVYAIRLSDGKLLAKIRVGNGPHGLAVYPQPGRYSLGHTGVFR